MKLRFLSALCILLGASCQYCLADPPKKLGRMLSEEELQAVLTTEFPGFTLPERLKVGLITSLSRRKDAVRIRLAFAQGEDVSGDGREEAVIACEFIDKNQTEPPRRDFLAIYSTRMDAKIVRVFRTEFEPSDRGLFTSTVLQDVTGDAVPEVCARYRHVNGGMHRWEWKDRYCIIVGRHPFKTVFDRAVGAGWGNVKGNGEQEHSEVVFGRPLEGGPCVIKVHSRKGKATDTVGKMAPGQSSVYEFADGKYRRR